MVLLCRSVIIPTVKIIATLIYSFLYILKKICETVTEIIEEVVEVLKEFEEEVCEEEVVWWNPFSWIVRLICWMTTVVRWVTEVVKTVVETVICEWIIEKGIVLVTTILVTIVVYLVRIICEGLDWVWNAIVCAFKNDFTKPKKCLPLHYKIVTRLNGTSSWNETHINDAQAHAQTLLNKNNVSVELQKKSVETINPNNEGFTDELTEIMKCGLNNATFHDYYARHESIFGLTVYLIEDMDGSLGCRIAGTDHIFVAFSAGTFTGTITLGENLGETLLHEIGHAAGLGHTSITGNIMCTGTARAGQARDTMTKNQKCRYFRCMYNKLCNSRSITNLKPESIHPKVKSDITIPIIIQPKTEITYNKVGGKINASAIFLPKVNNKFIIADNLLKKQKAEIFKHVGIIQPKNGYRDKKNILQLSNNSLIREKYNYKEYHIVRSEDGIAKLIKKGDNYILPPSKPHSDGKKYYYCIIRFSQTKNTDISTDDNRIIEKIDRNITIYPAYPEPGYNHVHG